MLEIILLILTLTAQLALGFIVYSRNRKSDVNRAVGGLAVSMALWSVATYFSLHPVVFSQIFWVRTVLSMAALLCMFVLVSFIVFPNKRISQYPSIKKFIVPYALFVMLWVQTPFVFSGLQQTDSGAVAPIVAPGIVLFTALVVGYIAAAIILLVRRYRKAERAMKNQIRPVLFGVGFTFVLLLLTNFVLVSFLKNTSLLSFGPDITLIFLSSLTYAILKHHLFDIRPVIARLLAYIGSLGAIVLIFLASSVVVSNIFLSDSSSDTSLQIWFAILSVVSALFFQPIKKFFDRTTNRFFYQDSYDGQELLNTLNSTLVTNSDIQPMLGSAAKIVASSLRPEFSAFELLDEASVRKYVAGTKQVRVTDEEVQELSALMTRLEQKTLVASELVGHKEMRDVLSKRQLELVVKLIVANQTIGYLFLGARLSGSQYSHRDIQLLETVADSVAIAAQNALRYEEIAQFNVTLQKKVDDATSKLQRSNEKLKALDEAKDEFISMASHQLRTPLTSVKGYVSMVLEEDAGKINEQQRNFLDQAYLSSQRMVYLIADLLNVSRLKTGKFVIEAKPTYLPDVVESEISQLYETAKARDLKLIFNKPESFPTLNLDETKIRQVIMNFTDNAIYYTPNGGKITLDLKSTKDSVEFTVRDTGIGVPKSEIPHLFVKFYRAGNAKKARPDGTGLGLFMAKKVVVAQGGAIVFKTEEGKGSTFGFSFPLSKLEIK